MPARRTTASTRAQEMKAKLNTPTKVAKKGVFGSLRGALGQTSFQLAENVADREEDGTDSSSQEDEDEQEAPEAEVTPAPTRRGSSKKVSLPRTIPRTRVSNASNPTFLPTSRKHSP